MVNASPKPANHIPTTAACDQCHKERQWAGVRFDHATDGTGTCRTCHNNVIMAVVTVRLTDLPFLPWLLHCYMAVLSIPLVFGHIYMATINKNSRVGLHGMVSGHVDREWAQHHYGRWYKEHFESEQS